MRDIFRRFLPAAITFALLGLLPVYGAVSDCTNTDYCQLWFDQSNSVFGSQNFGTLTLIRTTPSTIKVIVDVPGFQVIGGNGSGHAASFGFNDTYHDGSITASNFDPSLYGGYRSNTTQVEGFAAFGNFYDVAGTQTNGQTWIPKAGDGFSPVTFTVARTGGFNSVTDLLEESSNGAALFVADVYRSAAGLPGSGLTGLIAVTGTVTPEPGFYGLLSLGLGGLFFIMRRKGQKMIG